MKNHSFLLAVLAALLALTLVAGARSKGGPGASGPSASKPAGTEVAAAKGEVDGDVAYKANCMRCHTAPKKFSEREMVTVMRHMRVRANLTEAEEKAILRYLTR